MRVEVERDDSLNEDSFEREFEDETSECLKDAYDEEALLKLWKYWRERAMNFLVRREHSEVELRQKLRQRDCPSWMLDELMQWFYEKKYLSLERFAYSYTKNRSDLGYGPIRIRYELSGQHQIPALYIDEAFNEIDWDAARETAERKIKQTDEQKYRAALYRRGFMFNE